MWPNNLIRRPSGEVVLLDWAFTGDGALGEDVGNLIPDSVLDLLFPHDALDELDARLTARVRARPARRRLATATSASSGSASARPRSSTTG